MLLEAERNGDNVKELKNIENYIGIDASYSGLAMVRINSNNDILDYMVRADSKQLYNQRKGNVIYYNSEEGRRIGNKKQKTEIYKVQRMEGIVYNVISFIKRSSNNLVAIEDNAYNSVGMTFDIGWLCGQIKYALYRNKMPYIVLPIDIIKKNITGKGNAGKTEVMMSLIKKYPGTDVFNGFGKRAEDLFDAYAIALSLKAYYNMITGKAAINKRTEDLFKKLNTHDYYVG